MGRHRRPEPDALPDVDVASSLTSGPVIEDVGSARTATTVLPAVAPSTAPPRAATVVGRRSRAAQRAERRARARRRVLTIGGSALAVLLVLGLVAALVSRGSGDSGQAAAQKKAPRQQTLLVQVAGQDGTAAASALVGLTPGRKSATAVLVPSGLLVDVASSGSMPFGETLTTSPNAPSDALTDLLGVRVRHHWMLTSQGLAALVDKVGGVQAQVDTDVVTKDAKGRETVMARAGSQKLGGAAAAAYATYLADGETETSRLARFNEVLDGLVRQLPAGSAQIAATLAAAGEGSQSDLAAGPLAQLVTTLRGAADANSVRYEVLPVNDIDTGSTVDTYGLDSSKASALLQSSFSGSLQRDAAGDNVRVLVENGVGTPDLVEKARGRLVDQGFRFVNGGNSANLSNEPSVVLIKDGSETATERGQRVAAALGLPSSAIDVNPRGQTVADVIVILGADFKP